jgi:hypothetical protein
MALTFPGRFSNGGDNTRVCSAAADVTAHPGSDLVSRVGMPLLDAGNAGDDLTGRTVAALEGVLFNESGLQWMKDFAGSEGFDRGDLRSLVHYRQGQAGIDAPAIYENRARATGALIAAFLCPGQVKMLPQEI